MKRTHFYICHHLKCMLLCIRTIAFIDACATQNVLFHFHTHTHIQNKYVMWWRAYRCLVFFSSLLPISVQFCWFYRSRSHCVSFPPFFFTFFIQSSFTTFIHSDSNNGPMFNTYLSWWKCFFGCSFESLFRCIAHRTISTVVTSHNKKSIHQLKTQRTKNNN